MSRSSPLPPIGDRDHVAGSDSPNVTLVEYGDFGCPFCFAASVPVRGLLDRFDALRLVWRHFPDAELHPGADLAAELSELAAVHGRFWGAHSLLLAGRDHFTREDLLSVALREEHACHAPSPGWLDERGIDEGKLCKSLRRKGRDKDCQSRGRPVHQTCQRMSLAAVPEGPCPHRAEYSDA